MWKWIIRAALAVTSDPRVQQIARRQARRVIDKVRTRAEMRIARLYDAAGLEQTPKPKLSRLIRTEKDILRPGQIVIVDAKAYRVVRLLSSSAMETVYEGVEG